MGELARRVGVFETDAPVASHDAHAKYLENLEQLLRAAAVMYGQDAQIGGTWLRKRRPKRGRFIHLRERIAFGRRTRAHGRRGSKALAAAADKVRDLAAFHEALLETEKKARAQAAGRTGGRHAG
jgi:hypothetical protein